MTTLDSYFQNKSVFLESLFDGLQVGILVMDREFSIVQVNRWMEEKFAADMPLVGRKCHSVVCASDNHCPELHNIMALDPAKPFTRVFAFPSENDPDGWFECNIFRLEDDGGEVIGTIGYVRDVTTHKRTEKLLTDEVTWRRILVEQSRDGIVVIDEDGKVYESNRRFAEMLGYSVEEVHQLHVWDWDAQWSKEELFGMLRAVDHTGDHFQTSHRRKDGSIYEVEISTNGALYHGHKLVFCVCRDITERKRAEQEREKLITELREALNEIRTLRSILPLCAFCKKIRDDEGYWEQVDVYIEKHLQTDITHGVCPDCMKQHYPIEYALLFPEKPEE